MSPASWPGCGLPATSLPPVLTCSVKSPACAVPPSSLTTCLTTFSVGCACTTVSADALLFVASGSLVGDETEAVLCRAPAVVGVTLIVTVASPFAGTMPRSQPTVPSSCVQVPWLAVAEPNVTPAGSVSVTETESAASPPALWTVSV